MTIAQANKILDERIAIGKERGLTEDVTHYMHLKALLRKYGMDRGMENEMRFLDAPTDPTPSTSGEDFRREDRDYHGIADKF